MLPPTSDDYFYKLFFIYHVAVYSNFLHWILAIDFDMSFFFTRSKEPFGRKCAVVVAVVVSFGVCV